MVVTVDKASDDIDELVRKCKKIGLKHHHLEFSGFMYKILNRKNVYDTLKNELVELFDQIE